MIKQAKSTLSSVQNFKLAASAVKEYSKGLNYGIHCLDELFSQLIESESVLRDSVERMSSAKESLVVKINHIEEILARLTEKKNQLEDQLSDLESQLASVSPTITIIDAKGECQEISNPIYAAINAKIAAVEMEIDAVRTEIYTYKTRLNRVNEINSQLTSHTDATNGVIYSIGEKKNTYKQLRAELEQIQKQNLIHSSTAVVGLKKLEDIIANYLRIKMVYENAILSAGEIPGEQQGINIRININKTTNIDENTIIMPTEVRPVGFSKEEIESHRIQFDAAGRVIMYEGKTFGGKYKTYDDRLAHTIADNNPVLGRYTGVRGESKFIPSPRSAEGNIVIKLLNHYGIDGINYRNAEPDFEPCAEAVVKISDMTDNRENYTNDLGEDKSGNFSQADVKLAEKWNLENRGGRNNWKGRDVLNYRKANNLTWHEKCDTKTMVLVRTEINHFFKHSGGCSECRKRDSFRTDGGDFDE